MRSQKVGYCNTRKSRRHSWGTTVTMRSNGKYAGASTALRWIKTETILWPLNLGYSAYYITDCRPALGVLPNVLTHDHLMITHDLFGRSSVRAAHVTPCYNLSVICRGVL